MLQKHALQQTESESDADFVGREMLEYLALRDMGIHLDDSTRLTNSYSKTRSTLAVNSLLRLYSPDCNGSERR